MAGTIDIDLLYARAQGLAAASRLEAALELVEGQRQQLAGEPRFWVLYGTLLLASKRSEEAEQAGRQALNLEPGSLSAVDLLIGCAHQGKDYGRAITLAQVMVEAAPNEARGHYWVGLLLVSQLNSRTELEEAARAMARALEIDPENPDHYRIAALIADFSGNTPAALEYLSSGLNIAPNHSGLLLASGVIDGAKAVVGDKSAVLRGLLAVNPMDSTAREELSETFLQKLAPLGRLPWVHGMLAALLVQRTGGLWGILAITLLTAAFGGYGWMKFKRAAAGLPSGYAGEVIAETPGAQTGVKMLAVSALTVALGAGWGSLAVDPRPGLLALGAGVVAGFVGSSLLEKAACSPPPKGADQRMQNRYLHQRIGLVLGAHRVRFWTGAFGLLVLVLSLPESSYAPGMIMIILAGWLMAIGSQLAIWTLRLGPGSNPWAISRKLKAPAQRRGPASVVGNLQGAFYIGMHFFFPMIILGLGVSVLSMGTAAYDTPSAPANERKNSPVPVYPIQTQTPDFKMPSIPSMPSIDIPDFSTKSPDN